MKKLFGIGLLMLCTLAVAGVVYAQNPNGIRGAFSGNVFVRSPYRLGISGHIGSDSVDFAGTCTLVSTSCVVTFHQAYSVAPVCVATDQTAAAAVKAVPTTTNLTFTGTGTDVIAYHCAGNPN